MNEKEKALGGSPLAPFLYFCTEVWYWCVNCVPIFDFSYNYVNYKDS